MLLRLGARGSTRGHADPVCEPVASVPALRVLAVGAVAAVVVLPSVLVPLFNPDEATVATVARAMGSSHLYTGVVDRKPPLLFLLERGMALVTDTFDLRPLRLLELALVVGCAVLLGEEARRRYRVPAWRVAVVFLLAVVSLPPGDGRAVGFEMLSLLPLTLGFLAATRGRAGRSGAWLGVAILCKQTSIVMAAAMLWPLLRRGGRRAVVLCGASCAAVVVATAGLFGLRGFWFWVVAGNVHYADVTQPARAALRLVVVVALLCACEAGVIAGVALAARRRRADPEVLLWLATALCSALLGLRATGHYFLPVLPPLVLLAAPALADGTVRRLVAPLALSATVWTAFAFVPARVSALPNYDDLAEQVRQLSRPSDRIFVWGQLPQLYWATGRLPATRFPHVEFLTGIGGGRDGPVPYTHAVDGAWPMLWADLARTPPALIVDAAPLDGNGARYRLDESPLAAYVRDRFCVAARVEGAVIWQRRRSTSCAVDTSRGSASARRGRARPRYA